MAENQELPPLRKPTKHPTEVKGYMGKGAPESLARDIVTKDIVAQRRDKKVAELTELAMIDPLTGAFNRRYFDEQLKDAFTLTKREFEEGLHTQVGMLIFDLDKFKSVNDRFSHAEGDRVLKKFVESIKSMIREEDVFARLGGEEFGLLIREPHNLSSEELAHMVDRYRRIISEKVFTGPVGGEKTEPVTTSVGLVLYPNGAAIKDTSDFFSYADQALYYAKHNGRNQVVEFMGLDSGGQPQFSKVEVSPKG